MRSGRPRPSSAHAFLLVSVALSLAACGSSSSTDSGATALSATTGTTSAVVTIDNFAFSPSSLTIKNGATVTWTNDQGVTHTATADDDSWTSDNLARGATFAHKFDAAGTFTYHCAIHPNMKASIIVE